MKDRQQRSHGAERNFRTVGTALGLAVIGTFIALGTTLAGADSPNILNAVSRLGGVGPLINAGCLGAILGLTSLPIILPNSPPRGISHL